MRYLRLFIIVYTFLYIIAGILLLKQTKDGWYLLLIGYFFINTLIIIVATIIERNSRYVTNNISEIDWKPTNEKFIDDTSGKLMGVYYNSKTGERSYREID